ncbi:MAG: hypothetical protein L6Q92_03785 [Phycisphaerae bacterium]|nr:hypothetical protein [Phycisphaerae bacterium]
MFFPLFIQTPEDVLARCTIWSTAVAPVVAFINAILNPLGFFIPEARDACLAVYDILNSIFPTFAWPQLSVF